MRKATNVKARIKALEPLSEVAPVDKSQWTKEQKISSLQGIVANCMRKDASGRMINPGGAIAAIKELNLISGDNAPTKIESHVVLDNSGLEW